MPPKIVGIVTGSIGVILLIVSVASLNLPEISKWFPILVIGGGYLAWAGMKKYRAA
jgi:threonine/homoserine/homoserine lactone efflux protein